MSAVGRNFNEVRSGGMEQLQQLFPPLAGGFGKRLAHPTASGIQEQSFTGLCIFQLEESHIRNLFLTRVGNAAPPLLINGLAKAIHEQVL